MCAYGQRIAAARRRRQRRCSSWRDVVQIVTLASRENALSPLRSFAVLLSLASACVQSKHGDGPSGPPMPGGEVRLLEDRPGRGRAVLPGDRVRAEIVGRYASGEIWGRGPLTFIF